MDGFVVRIFFVLILMLLEHRTHARAANAVWRGRIFFSYLLTATNKPLTHQPITPSHNSRFLRWHASRNSESDIKKNAGTQNKRKNSERSSLTQLGVWPLEGVCHVPHSHPSSNEEQTSERSDDVSPLSNGRLCASAREKNPRTCAHSVGLFDKIVLYSLVCWCVGVCFDVRPLNATERAWISPLVTSVEVPCYALHGPIPAYMYENVGHIGATAWPVCYVLVSRMGIHIFILGTRFFCCCSWEEND